MRRFEAAQVRDYYDRHTPSFVRFGQGGRTGAIHRAVWGPSTTTRAEAFHYVEDRIADLVRGLATGSGAAPHVLDLGCGVGGSLCYLASRLPVRATGVTVSAVQAQWAARRIADAGLSDRVACLEADFCNLPPGVGQADLAYAIEAFVHAPSPHLFFDQCRSVVRPCGLLVICDDFRRPTPDANARRTVDRFARGWRINTLLDSGELDAIAGAAGFERESTTDLTPWLDVRRPRDRAIAALSALFGRLPIYGSRFGPMLGGSALQVCLERGWIGYDFVVFRRVA
jgi:cyclopropane fatty-acyl-phospholipid synthase-like methyltransferase